MNDSLFIATFDPLYVNAPDACSLCIAQPPAFSYEYCIEQNDGKRDYIKGFCRTACSAGLQKLAGREAQEWAEGGGPTGSRRDGCNGSAEAEAGYLWECKGALKRARGGTNCDVNADGRGHPSLQRWSL